MLRATAPGFQETVVREVILAPRDVRRIDIKLDIATLQERIEVRAGATPSRRRPRVCPRLRAAPCWLPCLMGGRGAFVFFHLTPNVTRVSGVYVMRFAGSRLNQGDSSVDSVSSMGPPAATPTRRDFSLVAAAVVDAFRERTPFPDHRLAASRLNAVSLKIQDRFYPLPTEGDPNVHSDNNFRRLTVLKGAREWHFTERVDHRISDKVLLTGRLVRDGYNTYRITSQLGEREPTLMKWNTKFYTFSYTDTLRPIPVDEFRVGHAYNNNPHYPKESGLALVKQLGLVGLHPNLPNLPGVFNVSFQNLTMTGISDALQLRGSKSGRNYYIQDHLNWFRGRHSLKVRGQFKHSELIDRFLSRNVYSNCFTNHSYADFLRGIPSSCSRAPENMRQDIGRDSYSLFIADQYHLSPPNSP